MSLSAEQTMRNPADGGRKAAPGLVTSPLIALRDIVTEVSAGTM